MRLSARSIRRAVLALAVSGASLLGLTAASAATRPAAHPAGPPWCTLSRMTVWIGLPGSGAAGSTAYPLEFSNTSRRACHLLGYPGVTAIGRSGHQLGSPASRDTSLPPRLVVLRPGGTAHAVLTVTDAGNFPARVCRIRTAVALRVALPGDHRPALVPLTFPACSRRGPRYLHVRVVRPGVGIPGVSQ
jgi:Protein of unknown function (DUF4232)